MIQNDPNPSRLGATLAHAIREAASYALSESRMKCILCTDGLDHTMITDALHFQNWEKISVKEILDNHDSSGTNLFEKPFASGILVTGYSNSLPAEDECTIQACIRSSCFKYPGLGLIVLSDSLPSISVFSMQQPWYNGPFENKTPYTLSCSGTRLILSRYSKAGERFGEVEPHWKEESQREF